MCLLTKNREAFIAEKEIEVFKVIDEDGFPPFYDSSDDKITDYRYHPGSNKPEGEKEVRIYNYEDLHLLLLPPVDDKIYTVGGGFLHAYTSYDRAKTCAKTQEMFLAHKAHILNLRGGLRKFRVVTMYIPTGAEYYVDTSGKEICATELIWKEE